MSGQSVNTKSIHIPSTPCNETNASKLTDSFKSHNPSRTKWMTRYHIVLEFFIMANKFDRQHGNNFTRQQFIVTNNVYRAISSHSVDKFFSLLMRLLRRSCCLSANVWHGPCHRGAQSCQLTSGAFSSFGTRDSIFKSVFDPDRTEIIPIT